MESVAVTRDCQLRYEETGSSGAKGSNRTYEEMRRLGGNLARSADNVGERTRHNSSSSTRLDRHVRSPLRVTTGRTTGKGRRGTWGLQAAEYSKIGWTLGGGITPPLRGVGWRHVGRMPRMVRVATPPHAKPKRPAENEGMWYVPTLRSATQT